MKQHLVLHYFFDILKVFFSIFQSFWGRRHPKKLSKTLGTLEFSFFQFFTIQASYLIEDVWTNKFWYKLITKWT